MRSPRAAERCDRSASLPETRESISVRYGGASPHRQRKTSKQSLNEIRCRIGSQHTFGLSGYVISWVRSYLTNRTSFVKIDSSSSPNTTICTAVPQGSVLGPLLFVLFISPVASVINPDQSNTSNIVSFHQYADDTQLYLGTNLSTLAHQVASIEFLHSEGSQLAPEQRSSPQSIQV